MKKTESIAQALKEGRAVTTPVEFVGENTLHLMQLAECNDDGAVTGACALLRICHADESLAVSLDAEDLHVLIKHLQRAEQQITEFSQSLAGEK